jgi:micrococcal nuclease
MKSRPLLIYILIILLAALGGWSLDELTNPKKSTPVFEPWEIIAEVLGEQTLEQSSESTPDHVSDQSQNQTPELTQETAEPYFHQVVSVTDGDTIKVLVDGKTETVRLVNMNAPESVDPRRPVECMGQEASEKMSELVAGRPVKLERDTTQRNRDRYGRLLRFVFLEDGTDVGLEMIKLGYAYSTPYGSSPHQYIDLYEQAEDGAREQGLGLWNKANCQ